MNDCIFCKIINNEIPSKTIYEDEKIKIIMNINPITNGHLLVIPQQHMVNINDIDIDIVNHSFKVIRDIIYPQLKEKLNCKGLTLSQNNELGQEIKHYHIHLIPRYEDDNTDFTHNEELLEDIEKIYELLK